MSSRLLFHLESPPSLEDVYDVSRGVTIPSVVTGYDVYVCDKNPQAVHASASISEQGPYILATKSHRPATAKELELKREVCGEDLAKELELKR